MPLRLVHPNDGRNGEGPPKRPKHARSRSLCLTPDEARHVRAATRAACRAYGGADVLASVMGVRVKKIHSVTGARGRNMSGTFVIRLAKAAGISVEAVLTGKLGEAGRCRACGHRVGDGRVVATGGA